MDKSLQAVYEKRVTRTIQALTKNRMDGEYIADRKALLARLEELMPEGCSCSTGGSATLDETGVRDYLRSGRFQFYDRYAPGVDEDDILHKALLCDVFLTSANAVTEDGKLYNIDGNGNRLSAMIWGPKKVIVIAGVNKIVPNLEAARERVRTIAAPADATRLGKQTPCVMTGHCTDCSSPDRICSHEVITHWQENIGRVRVLIIGEEYGY